MLLAWNFIMDNSNFAQKGSPMHESPFFFFWKGFRLFKQEEEEKCFRCTPMAGRDRLRQQRGSIEMRGSPAAQQMLRQVTRGFGPRVVDPREYLPTQRALET